MVLVSSSFSFGCSSGTSASPCSLIAGNASTLARGVISTTRPERSSVAQRVAMMISPLFFDRRVLNVETYQFQIDFFVVGLSASLAFFIGSSMIPRSIFLPVSGPPTPAQTYVPLWLAIPNSSVLRFTATPSAGLFPNQASGNMLRYSGVDIMR